MKDYLQVAKDFMDKARKELEDGKQKRDELSIRDACEKGWGATVQAINALFVKKRLSPLPRSHRQRRELLDKLEGEDDQLREKNFLDRFMARAYALHERGFYNGELKVESIERELEKVEKLIMDIESL
ncbi:MAG: DUF5618 family protein [bacterium]